MLPCGKGINQRLIAYLMAVYCLLLPFEEILAGPFGSVSKIVGLLVLAAIVLFNRSYKISMVWALLGAWLLICLLSFFWAESVTWWSYFLKIYVFQALFAFLVSHIAVEQIDLNLEKKGLVLGALIASVMLILFPTQFTLTAEGRRTIIFLDAVMDPNILATLILMAVFALISFYDKRTYKGLKRIAYYLALMLLLSGIFLTGSRGVLIAMVCSFTALFFLSLSSKGERTRSFLIAGVGAVLVLLIVSFLPEKLLLSRFSLESILGLDEYQAGVHNRYTIWENAFKLFLERPFFGYGCGNFFHAIATVYRETASHNVVVLSAIELGILGSAPLFAFLWITFRRTYRTGDKYIFCMLVAVLIISLTLDSLSSKYFWLMLIFCWHSIRKAQTNK